MTPVEITNTVGRVLGRNLEYQQVDPEASFKKMAAEFTKAEARTVERWGVPNSEIVIRYRFRPPQEGAALLWSRASPPRQPERGAGAVTHSRRSSPPATAHA
jgi:hypothetical protein